MDAVVYDWTATEALAGPAGALGVLLAGIGFAALLMVAMARAGRDAAARSGGVPDPAAPSVWAAADRRVVLSLAAVACLLYACVAVYRLRAEVVVSDSGFCNDHGVVRSRDEYRFADIWAMRRWEEGRSTRSGRTVVTHAEIFFKSGGQESLEMGGLLILAWPEIARRARSAGVAGAE